MDHRTVVFGVGIVLAISAAPSLAAPEDTPGHGPRHGAGAAGRGVCSAGAGERLATAPIEELSEAEISGLLYIREEEKLARDVYRTLSEVHDLPAFANIAPAEQHHMDLVALLLDRYGLTDPVTDDAVGTFSDPRLARLYTDLVVRGRRSLEEALRVGATIEDMDLADLARLEAATDNIDVDMIVSDLARGSRNHLRAFTGVLDRKGFEPYTPSHLDPDSYEAILASDHERGPGAHARGTGRGAGGGPGRGQCRRGAGQGR